MEQSPSEKLTGSQLVKKFPAFYGTRRFITAVTTARHLSLSWTSLIASIPPHPNSWRSILILSSHLRLDLQSGLFPPGFTTTTLYTPLLSPIRATCPAHFIILDLITRIILDEQYRSLSSSLCSFLHSPIAQIFPSAPFSRKPSAYVSSSMWATKFHTHIPYIHKYFVLSKGLYNHPHIRMRITSELICLCVRACVRACVCVCVWEGVI